MSEHHYDQSMVSMPSHSLVDSIVKPLVSDTSSRSTEVEDIIGFRLRWDDWSNLPGALLDERGQASS